MPEATSSTAPSALSRRLPWVATSIALLALVISLATDVSALPGRNTVDSNDLKRNVVTTPKIKNNAVTSPKIRDGSVTGADVRNGSLGGADLAPGSIGVERLAEHSMWALVDADGTLVESAGVVSVARLAPGIYAIKFAAPVNERPASATAYNTGFGERQVSLARCDIESVLPPGGCAFAGFNSANDLTVNTENSAGTNTDGAFMLVVHPGAPVVTVPATRRDAGPRGDLQ